MQLNKLVGSLVLSASLLATATAQAQPGNPIAESSVSADIKTLFSLAAEVAPAFKTGSGWYSYSGYTYQFFAASGIYAGVKDGSVYLIGGPYGSALTPRMTLAAGISSLQTLKAQQQAATNPGTTTADFGNIATVTTTADLPKYFQELTLEWVTVSGAISITSQMKMERVGVESVNGTSTEHLKLTLTASNVTGAVVSDAWVDANGNVPRFISNGFEYPAAQADFIGRGWMSGMVLAMVAPNSPTIRTAIDVAVKNPAVSTQVKKTMLAGGSYDTLTVTIGSAQTFLYVADVTDFGSFSMVNRFETRLFNTMSSNYSVISMKLR